MFHRVQRRALSIYLTICLSAVGLVAGAARHPARRRAAPAAQLSLALLTVVGLVLLPFTARQPTVAQAAGAAVVATAPVGNTPVSVAVNPSTNRVYVTNYYAFTVSVLDGTSGNLVTTIPVGSGASAAAANPTTDRVYVVNSGSNNVSVVQDDVAVDSPGAGSSPATATNLLTNGNFTSGITGWTPWCSSWSGYGHVEPCDAAYALSASGITLMPSYNPYAGIYQWVQTSGDVTLSGTITSNNNGGGIFVQAYLADANRTEMGSVGLYYRPDNYTYPNTPTQWQRSVPEWAAGRGPQTFSLSIGDTIRQSLPGVDPARVAHIRLRILAYDGYSATFSNLSLTAPRPADTVTPATSHTVSPQPSGGWNTANATVTLTATDNAGGSGVKEITYSASGAQSIPSTTAAGGSASVTVTAEGETTVTYAAKDNAGNVEAAKSLTIKVDKTAPAIQGSRSPAANELGWHKTDVTVSFTCSDATSGVKTCPSATILSGEGADQSAGGTATDNAGLSASATIGGINIDKTAPALSGAPTTSPNAAGWYRGDATIRWTASDALSGVNPSTVPGESVIGSEGLDLTAQATVSDRAGNPATATSPAVKIDRTAPTVTYAGNAGSYMVDQTVSITCSAADNLSGLASDTCAPINGPAYSFNLGANSFSASATDQAGNVGNGSTGFSVRADTAGLARLTKQFVTNQGIANALVAKLEAAAAAAARGNAAAKAGALDAYRHQVAAQSGKALTTDQAAILTRLADAL